MPVNRLLAEGKLDIEIFGSLFAGLVAVDPTASSKSSLAPRAKDIRRESKITVCYIRDRDFDFLPPDDLSQPTCDKKFDDNTVLGWRWCRHEIENYLIEPAILHDALGWDQHGFEQQLIQAARNLKFYQASRWGLGKVRQDLSHVRYIPSRPTSLGKPDFRVPDDLGEQSSIQWMQAQAAAFLAEYQQMLDPNSLAEAMKPHTTKLTDAFLGNVQNVLVWCSGKDLLAALIPWLQAKYKLHPTLLRDRVRDWMCVNQNRTFELLPEWMEFRNILQNYA